MTRLAPDLFARRYDDFVGLGRSRLPSYAPAWTDHNAHDPGITLIELLAWVGEAQLYSLARTRRDERRAYSALMGVEPHGARPARGLIWPDHADLAGPAATMTKGQIIERDAAIRLDRSETPRFRPLYRQLWIPARVAELKTRLANGTEIDQLQANLRGGPAFQPFGADEGQGAVLRMGLAATGAAPLFESGRPSDARLVIGVRADTAPVPSTADTPVSMPDPSAGPCWPASLLEVTLVADGDHIPLPIFEDSTEGFLRTGAIVLDMSGVEATPIAARLEFRAPAGFDRAPRILRIEPNVVPIIQSIEATTEHDGDGLPDQGFDLDSPGLEFEPGSDPVHVQVELNGSVEKWTMTDRLDDCGPSDKKFTLDTVAAHLSFGNGVNGVAPSPESRVVASYSVAEGQPGNIAANRKWVVRGFGGLFGINPDPTSGGEDPSGWEEQRREARRIARDRHPIVSAKDFEEAARDLPELEVGRAWMMPPSAGDLVTGSMRLVVMRRRSNGEEPSNAPESSRWLSSVRQRLAPQVPLGSRLRVTAPRYVDFMIICQADAEPRLDPVDVREAVKRELSKRLTLVSDQVGAQVRPFGLPVSRQDLVAWIQALAQVRQVLALAIRVPGLGSVTSVVVPKDGLPRIDLESSQIDIVRSGGAA